MLEINNIYNMDCLDGLKQLSDNSVDSIVTDPPYELGFMGKAWDKTGVAYNIELWKECLRVLKPGGYLLAFGGCYDELTECLTSKGWKFVKDITKNDLVATLNPTTHYLEYNHPVEIVKQNHYGKMYHFKTNKIDLLVTDNHKMYVSTLGNNNYSLKRADDCVNKAIKMKKNCNYTKLDIQNFTLPKIQQSNGHYIVDIPEKIIPMNTWLKFFGLWIAQGSTSIVKVATGYNYKTQICHFNLKRLQQLKEELSPYFNCCIYENEGKFIINDKQLTEYLKQFGKSSEKYIPDEIKQTSSLQLEIFLEWYLEGDGDRNSKRKRGYTSSKKLVDDLQEIALFIGISADYSIQKQKENYIKGRKIQQNHNAYIISFNMKQNEPEVYNRNNKNVATELQWNDLVYCIEVPNHIFYVRRNGKTAWCGNTRTYHRMVCAIEDAGFEIRDQIQWIYGSGFPKSYNISKGIEGHLTQGSSNTKDYKKLNKKNIKTQGLGFNKIHLEQGDRPESYKLGGTFDLDATTQEAKQWDGWGTATKPAHEDIIVATKPITIDYILNNSLEEIIKCLKLFALIVEKNFMLNQQDLNVELNIAQWNVEANINLQENFKEVMDIFLLEIQKENIDLNIILSWKNILEESYYLMNKYTIETILKMIIELKTLNYLQFQNILRDIIKVKMLQNGQNVNALIVIRNLIEFTKKLNAILLLFVQENVILKENKENCVNNEPIVVARKPLSEKTVAENVLKWGTGGINIDGCRIAHNEPVKTTQRHGRTNASVMNEESCGFDNTKNNIASANPEGRFPANIIFDEEAGKLLDEQSGTSKSSDSVRKNNGKHDNKTFGKYNAIDSYGFNDSGGASRFFYCAKASKSERGDGNFHPTVKPIKLIKYLIKLVTPPNGICLDPFEGSGTHAIACSNLGFNYIGFEMNEEYCEIANKRIEGHIKI